MASWLTPGLRDSHSYSLASLCLNRISEWHSYIAVLKNDIGTSASLACNYIEIVDVVIKVHESQCYSTQVFFSGFSFPGSLHFNTVPRVIFTKPSINSKRPTKVLLWLWGEKWGPIFRSAERHEITNPIAYSNFISIVPCTKHLKYGKHQNKRDR